MHGTYDKRYDHGYDNCKEELKMYEIIEELHRTFDAMSCSKRRKHITFFLCMGINIIIIGVITAPDENKEG